MLNFPIAMIHGVTAWGYFPPDFNLLPLHFLWHDVKSFVIFPCGPSFVAHGPPSLTWEYLVKKDSQVMSFFPEY